MSRRLLIVGALTISAFVALVVARGWRPSSEAAGTTGHDSHAMQSEETTTPRADVSLDTRRQQLIGVRIVRVGHEVLAPDIRAAGTVTYDETRQVEVNTRIDGWIRELYADYTGRAVKSGEPLFTLYSPDLIAEQNDYLLALRGRSKLAVSDPGGLADYSDRLAAAARERLRRLEMTDAEIDEVARTGQAAETITFRSPATGVIVEKAALRGTRVMAGQMLYRLADLSTVWVEAEVYETDLAMVRTGMRASIAIAGYPDRTFAGRIDYIYPLVTQDTRTVRVRIVLRNPGGLLRPNMLATVTLQTPGSHALTVPADAVVDTGTQQLVFRRGRRRTVYAARGASRPPDRRSGGAALGCHRRRPSRGKRDILPRLRKSASGGAAEIRAARRPGRPVGCRVRRHVPNRARPSAHWREHAVVGLKDSNRQPISDADVKVVLFMPPMPTMNMPAARSEATLVAAGAVCIAVPRR
jgi:multidrug efflux pump subunit AcrA (membrane-fusion protein)